MDLENAEEILQILERYTKQKSKTIPDELNSYLTHVALTGDSVYSWSKVQYFFREKLAHVIKDFHDTTPTTEDLPISRNVDAFNYDSLKTSLLERFDLFNAAPFTIQRLSELLSEPKKHYCRLDKFMRALEKNILVVSTVEPGHRQMDSENGDSINGDPLMDINVDVEMDKEPSSSNGSTTDKKPIATQADANIDKVSTENKTEQVTIVQSEETGNDDDDKVSTNGHHSDDSDDKESNEVKVSDEAKVTDEAKVNDARSVECGDDKTAEVETITVEIQPSELDSRDDSVELQSDVATAEPFSDASHIIKADVEQSSELESDVNKPLDEKHTSESQVDPNITAENESNDIAVEVSQNVAENAKHSRPRQLDSDEEYYRPSLAKLPKLEQLDIVEEKVSSDSEKVNVDVNEVTSTEIAQVSNEHTPSENNEEKEAESEPVLPTTTPPVAVTIDEQSNDGEQLSIDTITSIPTDNETTPLSVIDDSKCDSQSADNASISPLASTISNDLDILDEREEDELIEPIITDAATEQNLLESSTALSETDVEMLPLKSVDNPEQMAVEDPTTTAASLSINTDSAMEATQIIPSTDEQMDVLETNLMDQMDL